MKINLFLALIGVGFEIWCADSIIVICGNNIIKDNTANAYTDCQYRP